LHDGAVLIEDDRIIAASCYLPLSVSTKLKKTHGARHRAAMGMSEETDAVIIVTSEETGKISVMINGELEIGIKALELKKLLYEELYLKKKPKSKNDSILNKNGERHSESEVGEASLEEKRDGTDHT
jgi:diadenylate cyclase